MPIATNLPQLKAGSQQMFIHYLYGADARIVRANARTRAPDWINRISLRFLIRLLSRSDAWRSCRSSR